MNRKSALIVGRHPMTDAVVRQYEDRTFSVIRSDGASYCGEGPDEIFIATEARKGEEISEDIRNIDFIRRLCNKSDDSKPIRCHLLLHSSVFFKRFMDDSFCADLKGKAELYPFTAESAWAQRMFTLIPGQESVFSFLDRIPDSADSAETVHIVVLGLNAMTEALTEYAALTCHYPNYIRDHSLRTRITIIDDDMSDSVYSYVHSHKSLFDNSYYRLIDLKHPHGATVKEFHVPEYADVREDWVDVEWEFVNGGIWSEVLRNKLQAWSADESQYLTVILGNESDDDNIAVALELKGIFQDNDVPVLVRTTYEDVVRLLPELGNFIPFGMKNFEYDIDLPLVKMAQMVNYVYQCCYEDNYLKGAKSNEIFSPVAIEPSVAESLWQDLSYSKKLSNIYNAMTIPVKMRSLGHTIDDWSAFYAMSAKEIALLAEIEHNRWNVATLLLGYRPVNAVQEKEIEKDVSLKKKYRNRLIHYDLRSYKDLRADATGRNANTYDICLAAAIPLIAKTYITEIADGRNQ